MNGSGGLYDENPAASGGNGSRSGGGSIGTGSNGQQHQSSAANNSGSSEDNNQQQQQQQQLSPGHNSSSVPVSASGPLHIPAKRLGGTTSSSNNTVPVGSSSSSSSAIAAGNYPHHQHHSSGSVDPNGGVNGSVGDASGGGGTGLLRAQPWPYSVGDVAAQHAAATASFDPQSYSPSSMAAAAAAAYYGTDRAKAALSFWPSDYGKYGAAAAAAAAGPSAAEASAQFNAQAAWCGYAGYGSRVPEPHGHPGLGPAPGQPSMGVPVSVAGYLAAEAHEVRTRGAMDAAAAVACGFPPPHDSYAGLRGYAPGPDGMPPSVYGPGKWTAAHNDSVVHFFNIVPIIVTLLCKPSWHRLN